MAWREDHRRESNGQQDMRRVSAAAKNPVSRNWKDYWQRRAKIAAEQHKKCMNFLNSFLL
jgi:hypothetical protein